MSNNRVSFIRGSNSRHVFGATVCKSVFGGPSACAERHSPKKARNYPCDRAKPVSSYPRRGPARIGPVVAKYRVSAHRVKSASDDARHAGRAFFPLQERLQRFLRSVVFLLMRMP